MRTGLFISLARIWMSLCGIGTTVAAVSVLDPVAFGVFAVASSVGLFFQQIVGAGAQEAFLGRTVDERGAHAFATLTGLVSVCLLIALAWAASVTGWPLGAATCLVFAITVFLWSLATIADARATREGRGERIFVAVALADTAGLVVAVGGLLVGWGGYALAAGKLAQGVTHYVAFSLLMRQVLAPSLALRDLRGYGRRFAAFSLPRFSGWADGYAADLVIGGLLSPAAAGQFRLASRFAGAFQSIVTNSLNVILLAEVGRRTHPALKAARMMRVSPSAVVLVGFAVTIFSILVSFALARFGRGAWEDAAVIVLWLAVATPALVVNGAVTALLTGQDATRRIVNVQVVRLALATLGMTAGAAVSATASAAARSLLSALAMVGCVPFVTRRRGQRRRMLSPLLRQTAVILATVLVAQSLTAVPGGLGGWTSLVILLSVGLGLQAALTFPELVTTAREARAQWALRRPATAPRGRPLVELAPQLPTAEVTR
uniref:oligosaccharide flippase family protein n=1 Tax=Methylobacterium sp. TaxID=409 RepID=UPI0020C89CC2|nr:oligosaccharide flippase family protein [Methylobacterium sp.]USU34674.1 oligosaccharide flippase family protein [Methylobacterium sp.]